MYNPTLFPKNQPTIVAEIARKEALRVCECFFDNVVDAVTDMIVANNNKIEEDLAKLGILPKT